MIPLRAAMLRWSDDPERLTFGVGLPDGRLIFFCMPSDWRIDDAIATFSSEQSLQRLYPQALLEWLPEEVNVTINHVDSEDTL